MERLVAFAILLAVVLATGGEDIVAEDPLESPVTPGPETTELASSLKEPRLFPFGDTWLMVAAESAGERGPYGQLPCALDLRQIGKGASTRIAERVRIVLPSAGAIPPPYALKWE